MTARAEHHGGTARPAVAVRGVSKIYEGGVEALNDITLDFPEGELTTLLGPSGCGKTTLLKIIAGLIAPSGGSVRVDGKDVTGPGPERAFVFQDFALMPWATVMRNVAFGLELRGTGKAERQRVAQKCIAEVGLKGFEDAYPHALQVPGGSPAAGGAGAQDIHLRDAFDRGGGLCVGSDRVAVETAEPGVGNRHARYRSQR